MNSKTEAANSNQLDEKIRSKIEEVKAFEHNLPLVVIIINILDSSVVYMSERGRKILNVSMEELEKMGPNYHSRFFNAEDARDYVPKLLGLLERNNTEFNQNIFT